MKSLYGVKVLRHLSFVVDHVVKFSVMMNSSCMKRKLSERHTGDFDILRSWWNSLYSRGYHSRESPLYRLAIKILVPSGLSLGHSC